MPAFFWKLLALEGFQPLLDTCAVCGADGDLVAFDVAEGGMLCRACRRGTAVSPEALAVLRRILDGGLAGVLREPAGPVSAEVDTLATRALEHHLERRLRSVGIF